MFERGAAEQQGGSRAELAGCEESQVLQLRQDGRALSAQDGSAAAPHLEQRQKWDAKGSGEGDRGGSRQWDNTRPGGGGGGGDDRNNSEGGDCSRSREHEEEKWEWCHGYVILIHELLDLLLT